MGDVAKAPFGRFVVRRSALARRQQDRASSTQTQIEKAARWGRLWCFGWPVEAELLPEHSAHHVTEEAAGAAAAAAIVTAASATAMTAGVT